MALFPILILEAMVMVRRFSTRAVVEASVGIALAVALSYVRVWKLPQGGSVTAGSMIPIIFVALRWGPGVGISAGVVYGLLQFALEPFFVHPVQFILDYPLAFGFLGFAGVFRRQPAVGAAAGIAGRFLSHLISGVVFFASYARNQNVWVYSAIYNGSYLLPELVISSLVMVLLAKAFAARGGLVARN